MTKRISHSYYVAMIDYGRAGLEAIVRPEHTRRDIVEMLKSGETKCVAFIHHVDGLFIEDVTDELFNEAELELRAAPVDARAAQFDHAQDHRKNWVA